MKVLFDESIDAIPRVLPPGWGEAQREDGVRGMFGNPSIGLAVILGVELHDDDRKWLHISASRRARIPDYEDMCLVKRIFIGAQRKAVMVFAPESEHINDHSYVLHLWACLDGDPLPDFRRHGTI